MHNLALPYPTTFLQTMPTAPAITFIIHSTHITENLAHHKLADVQRILEDKGFQKENDDGAEVHFRNPGNPENSKRTQVSFDAQGFVVEGTGLQHFEV